MHDINELVVLKHWFIKFDVPSPGLRIFASLSKAF